MPALALVGLPGPRWLPPFPVPLFLAWPFIPLCLALAWMLGRDKPDEAAKLRVAVELFRDLRGLSLDVDGAGHRTLRVRFL